MAWRKLAATLSFTVGATWAQTRVSSTSTAAGDGLSMTAGSATASYNTILNDGMLQTYRVIPTLPASINDAPPQLPNIVDPQAVDSQSVCPGYTASNVVPNEYGFDAMLGLAGPACNSYGTDIQMLNMTVEYQSDSRLHVFIRPSNITSDEYQQYIIPKKYAGRPTLAADAADTITDSDLQFTWSNDPSFGFSVLRKSTGEMLFNSIGKKIVYQNQFLEFVSELPENYNLYGLGERIHALRLGNNFTATTWNIDAGDPIDANIYGTHPFYLDTRYYSVNETTGEMTLVDASNATNPNATYKSYSHGVYLRNAHGQEVLLNPMNITWRTLGGSMDMYFFGGPDATSVTKQYQEVIGKPALQKYDAFGYHQCRWGYQNWTVMQEIVDNFRRFDIPLEYIWNDIDYMNQYRDFDNDQNRFSYPEAKTFLDRLHSTNQRYIPIVDSAIYTPNPDNASDAYGTYARGHAMNAFMLTQDPSQEYVGAVWPGFTVFPDWRSNQTQDWWSGEMTTWHQNVSFDGIWIDMSEASSFCRGACGVGRLAENPIHPPFALPGEPGSIIYDYPEGFNVTNSTEAAAASSASVSQNSANAAKTSTAGMTSTTVSYLRTTPTAGVRNVTYPPYVINNYNGDLNQKGLDPAAKHHDGVDDYDIHNMWGFEILNATYNALRAVFPGKRPLIIGRSTFAGAGTVAGHWGGDNYSQWRYMFFSIPQALSFSLFGIPMFGVDTCGFNGNSDEELCNRWMQLSAFFPFYRNHNTLTANSQEPYVWSSVIEATKTAMAIRYSIIPYMYTLFHASHATGSTVMRALAWEFPDEPYLAAADRQFLLGPALMVTPVLEQGADSVGAVFPGTTAGTIWYDWYTGAAMSAMPYENKTISAPLGHIPLFLRGGYILPTQQPGYTTTESRRNPWDLVAALDGEGSATGSLYMDDGESVAPNSTRSVDMTVSGDALYVSGRGTWKDNNTLSSVKLLGVKRAPTSVTINGKSVGATLAYNQTTQTLLISGLMNATTGGVWNADFIMRWDYGASGNATVPTYRMAARGAMKPRRYVKA